MKCIVVPHPGKEAAKQYAKAVRSFIKEKKHQIVRTRQNADIAIILGGDGFMMDQLQIFGLLKVPCVGINLGDEGFTTICTKNDWQKCLEQILNGKYEVEERVMLTVHFRNKRFGPFCGDVSIEHRSSVCGVRAFVNKSQVFETVANGALVSTPMGSTAYCASLRGPIIRPGTEAIAVLPIAAMNLSVLPIVERADAEVKMCLISSKNNASVPLRGSGGLIGWMKVGEEIIVKRHERNCLFVTFKNYDFYKTLRTKKKFSQ